MCSIEGFDFSEDPVERGLVAFTFSRETKVARISGSFVWLSRKDRRSFRVMALDKRAAVERMRQVASEGGRRTTGRIC
jgi:hypothetical protein